MAQHQSTATWGNVSAVSESRKKEGVLLAGTDDGQVQFSLDGGANWRRSEKPPGLPDYGSYGVYVQRVYNSKTDESVAYALFDNSKNGDFKPYVYKSTNQGASWTSISGDLPANGPALAFAEEAEARLKANPSDAIGQDNLRRARDIFQFTMNRTGAAVIKAIHRDPERVPHAEIPDFPENIGSPEERIVGGHIVALGVRVGHVGVDPENLAKQVHWVLRAVIRIVAASAVAERRSGRTKPIASPAGSGRSSPGGWVALRLPRAEPLGARLLRAQLHAGPQKQPPPLARTRAQHPGPVWPLGVRASAPQRVEVRVRGELPAAEEGVVAHQVKGRVLLCLNPLEVRRSFGSAIAAGRLHAEG